MEENMTPFLEALTTIGLAIGAAVLIVGGALLIEKLRRKGRHFEFKSSSTTRMLVYTIILTVLSLVFFFFIVYVGAKYIPHGATLTELLGPYYTPTPIPTCVP